MPERDGLNLEEDFVSHHFRPLLVSALILSSACAGESATGPAALSVSASKSANVAVTRPAGGKCTVNGQFTLVPDDGTVATFHATGSCNLKHLGRTAIVIDEYFFEDGSITNSTDYTAANGDVLNSTWYSAPDENSFLDGNAVFAGDETYIGGTGRFDGATGSSFVQGTATVGRTGAFTGQYTSNGSITF